MENRICENKFLQIETGIFKNNEMKVRFSVYSLENGFRVWKGSDFGCFFVELDSFTRARNVFCNKFQEVLDKKQKELLTLFIEKDFEKIKTIIKKEYKEFKKKLNNEGL